MALYHLTTLRPASLTATSERSPSPLGSHELPEALVCLELQERREGQARVESPWRAFTDCVPEVGDGPIVVAQRGEDLSKRQDRVAVVAIECVSERLKPLRGDLDTD